MESLQQEMYGLARQLHERMKGWQTAYGELTKTYSGKGISDEEILSALEAAGYATSTPFAYALNLRDIGKKGELDITKSLRNFKQSKLSSGFIAETLGVLFKERPLSWLLDVLKKCGFSLGEALNGATSYSPLMGFVPDPKKEEVKVAFNVQNLAYVGWALKKAGYEVDLSQPSMDKGLHPRLEVRKQASKDDPLQPLFSPDIIPRLTPVPSFRHEFGVANDGLWNKRFNEDQPHAGKTSVVYVRFSNTGNVPVTPACALYYTKAGTVAHPNHWDLIGIQSAKLRMPPGAREVLEFKVEGLQTGHYCFVAVIDSGLFPAIIPDPMLDAVDLVNKRANIGWHNFEVVNVAPGSQEALPEFLLGNIHSEEGNFKLKVHPQGLPAGVWKLTGKVNGIPIKEVFLEGGKVTEIHGLAIKPSERPKINLFLDIPSGAVINPKEPPHLTFIQERAGKAEPYGGINFHLLPKA